MCQAFAGKLLASGADVGIERTVGKPAVHFQVGGGCLEELLLAMKGYSWRMMG